MDRKFIAALSVYAGLAILAGFTLDDPLRLATWIFLGLFALKTWLVVLKRRAD
jgi:hypothetical protein